MSKSKARLFVMLSGSGTTLQNILDRQASGALGTDVVGVLSDRHSAYGLSRAESVAIPTFVLSIKECKSVEDYKTRLWELWLHSEVDLIVLAGFLSLVPVDAEWLGRIINVHPALLPRFGGKGMYGLNVHRAVLRAGEKISGCTVHFVDHDYDTGPIIEQAVVPVLPEDNEHSLQERVQAAERELYPKVISDVMSKRLFLEDGVVVKEC